MDQQTLATINQMLEQDVELREVIASQLLDRDCKGKA